MTTADDSLVNPLPGAITVWSDIGCPWATLALHTLQTRAERQGVELLIDHRAFPLELFNRMPTPKSIVEAEMVIIAGRVPELGWRLWDAPEHTFPVTTLPALEAVQAAKDPAVGGLRASSQLDFALRRAFYADNRCISIHAVILEIAASCPNVDKDALAEALAHGAGRQAVYEQWRRAQQPDVQGSPHVFTTTGDAWHNPGVTYHWTGRPPVVGGNGFPVLESYNPDWVTELLDKTVS
jgi:predicted DsbA family dithiol-disulfide isomerase